MTFVRLFAVRFGSIIIYASRLTDTMDLLNSCNGYSIHCYHILIHRPHICIHFPYQFCFHQDSKDILLLLVMLLKSCLS